MVVVAMVVGEDIAAVVILFVGDRGRRGLERLRCRRCGW
jgi:hypothetical protein